MKGLDDRECHALIDKMPIIPGRDVMQMTKTVRLYLGDDAPDLLVETVAQILVDTARGLDTPFTGQIWVASWGYEQTNVDYYEVVKATNTTAYLAKIRDQRLTDRRYGDRGTCVPLRAAFEPGEAVFFRRLSKDGRLRIEDGIRASPWQGDAQYWSTYA